MFSETYCAGSVPGLEVGYEPLAHQVCICAKVCDLCRHARREPEMISEPAGRGRLQRCRANIDVDLGEARGLEELGKSVLLAIAQLGR